jgi:hypothetical protein
VDEKMRVSQPPRQVVYGRTGWTDRELSGLLYSFLPSSDPLSGVLLWCVRSPGGSSGGEAALLAAHASPLGIGSDIG